MRVEQLGLDAAPWWPPFPDDPDTAALALKFHFGGRVLRPEPGTGEDRAFRRRVAALRDLGWPIVARGDGWYELTFESAAVEGLLADLRSRALSLFRSYRRVKRTTLRRAA